MAEDRDAPLLVPLSLPELVDRALTIYLQTARRTALVAAFPAACVGFLPRLFQTPQDAANYGQAIVSSAVYAVTAPLLVIVLAAAVRGRHVSLAGAARIVADRAPAIAWHLVPWGLLFSLVYAGMAALQASVNATDLAKSPHLSTFVEDLSIAIVVAFVLVFVAAMGLATLIFIASCAAVLIEGRGSWQANAAAWRRMTQHGMFRRALQLTALKTLLLFTALVMSILVLGVFGVDISSEPAFVLILTAWAGFSLCLDVVFYFDARIRTEGLDLAVALSELPPLAGPSPARQSSAGASLAAD